MSARRIVLHASDLGSEGFATAVNRVVEALSRGMGAGPESGAGAGPGAEAGAGTGAGTVAIFPTDTVIGIGARADDAHAIDRIFVAKGRDETTPIACLVASLDRARTLSAQWPDPVAELAQAYWPGPLTLVVPTRGILFPAIQRAGPTLGLRVPASPVLRAVLERLDVPLAATSANLSGETPHATLDAVEAALGEAVDLVIETDDPLGGTASSVVCWRSDRLVVLRSGPVPLARIPVPPPEGKRTRKR